MVVALKRENLMLIAGISPPVFLRWNQIASISLILLRTMLLTWKFHQLKITCTTAKSLKAKLFGTFMVRCFVRYVKFSTPISYFRTSLLTPIYLVLEIFYLSTAQISKIMSKERYLPTI
ncbi:BgTH12-06301 [Blumeria graminis f. sp. triticale]|uniref:BgTH12-06301 n=1 Tax=Blumeria graminis f. sp. triticale TaxID=1689686 RepID=A0A9W4DJ32_BLUGR|nr:BgTH12-06301 [Blumeria graminis f. sp. triticale]